MTILLASADGKWYWQDEHCEEAMGKAVRVEVRVEVAGEPHAEDR